MKSIINIQLSITIKKGVKTMNLAISNGNGSGSVNIAQATLGACAIMITAGGVATTQAAHFANFLVFAVICRIMR